MSLQFGNNNVLDLWLGGSHQDELHVHDVGAKRKGVTDRDQVQAVVQALQRQQSRATGTIPARAEPINEVARAFLLSGPKQDVRILSSPTPNAGPPPSAIQSARTPPTATQTARALSNATRNTEIAPSASQRVENPSRLAANDSLIKARYASTVLRVARTSDHETAVRLVRAISRDLPLQSEIPEIADLHRRAIAAFDQLATGLVETTSLKQQPLWKTALDAAAEWLRAVQPSGDSH
jgi:hypothetical protein